MSLLRFLQRDTWLLVFVGGLEQDREAVRDYLTKAKDISNLKPPKYYIESISAELSRKIPAGPRVDNEVSEAFNEYILNAVIEWKNTYKATQVAIIFSNRAFPSDDVFIEIVNDRIFKELNYHAICYRGNFISTERRKQCVKSTDCTQCCELIKGCEHSCLIRLLWLMFNGKDDKVLEVLDNLVSEDKPSNVRE